MKQMVERVQLTIVAEAPIGVKDCVRGTLSCQDDRQFLFEENQPWYGLRSTQTVMRRQNLRIARKKDGAYRVSITVPAEAKDARAIDTLLYSKYEQAREYFRAHLEVQQAREQPQVETKPRRKGESPKQ